MKHPNHRYSRVIRTEIEPNGKTVYIAESLDYPDIKLYGDSEDEVQGPIDALVRAAVIEEAGYKLQSVAEFLGLTSEESALIEVRRLGHSIIDTRMKRGRGYLGPHTKERKDKD